MDADGADWAERERDIRDRIAAQGFMGYMRAVVETLAPGSCVISLASRPELMQQHGYIHGGCLAFMMDNSTTIAAATLLRKGQAVLTAEFKINFLAPAKGERLVARARVVKPGRTMTISAGDIFAVQDGEERHVATGLATISIVAMPG